VQKLCQYVKPFPYRNVTDRQADRIAISMTCDKKSVGIGNKKKTNRKTKTKIEPTTIH